MQHKTSLGKFVQELSGPRIADRGQNDQHNCYHTDALVVGIMLLASDI